MVTMDEYIEQLLAEMPDNQSTLHDVVKNILDEPISDSVKARLLKPLQPGKYRPSPPPRKAKERKRKALEEEFDPIPRHKSLRSAVPKEQYLDDILDFSFDKKEAKTDELVFKQTPWALGNFLRGWQMDVPKGHPQGADPRAFLEDAELLIQKKLEEELKALKGGLKFQLALKVDLEKANPDGSEEYTDPVLRHKQEAVLQKSEIKAALHQAFPRVQETLEKWTQRGSGWAVDQVHTLWLDIARYQPLRGGSYIPLPAAVKNKKAVVNVKNKDDHCLRWALRAALFQVAKDPQRPTKYPTEDGLDFTGIDAPTPISQIPKVEWQNDLAINVFGWDKGVIVHHISNQPEDMPRTNLLLIEKAGKFHYTWIKNLSRLLYDQSKHREKKHFCERCLHGYSRGDLLEDHKPECQGIGQTAVRVEMPEEGKNNLTFQNNHRQLPAPYIIYADFEALTTKLAGPELDPTMSNTQKTQHHKACSYSYIVVRCDGQTEKPVEYRGPNAAEHFLQALQEEEQKIKGVMANPKAMRMTREDWRAYNTATLCYVCNKPLEGDSVRDHCHITGRFRGAAHNACNLKLRLNPQTTTIPVVFHNLRGYDSHLLMQAISKVEGQVSCIPNNTEKYISFSLGQLRFIDSAQFLLATLDKLVAANSPEAFQITACYEPDSQKRQLLLRKGVYPYEYMDSWERFEETALPPKEAFYSKLSDEHISDSDYAHAQQVWKTFECRTLGDYTVLYCRTDVLLLADVFENFRKTCQKQYGLDPTHYYTSPGLSWDALLKKTGVSLELITDYDQHLFIEKGMRGGISMVSKRHARANNPAVEGYNPEKPNSHILYLDANNLYGWAMSQPLPTGGFQWVEDCDRLADSVKNLPADGAEGYILEVDLEYPQGLHDEHNAYPLAPERMVVQKEWMSDYQQELLGVGVAPTEVEKLVPNLRDKERYVLHYRNLQLYLSLGMRVKKVSPCPAVRAEPLDGAIHPDVHRTAKSCNQWLRKGPLQADEQRSLRQDNGEPPQTSECQVGSITWGRQAAPPNCQPVIRQGKHIWRWSGCSADAQEQVGLEPTHLCGDERSRPLEESYVRFLLQPDEGPVWRLRGTPVYGYRQPSPWDPDGGGLQRHVGAPKPLWYIWLPGRPPSAQQSQQEGLGQNEGWVCWTRNRGVCRAEAQDVLHPRSLRGLHQEGKGCKKERCEEAHQARAIQRGSIR